MGSAFDTIPIIQQQQLIPILSTQTHTIYQLSLPILKQTTPILKTLSHHEIRNKLEMPSRSQQSQSIAMSIEQRKCEIVLKKCLPSEQNLLDSFLSQMGFVNGQIKYQNIVKNNVCSVLGYFKEFKPFFCGGDLNFNILFEHHGEYSLEQQRSLRAQSALLETQDRKMVKKKNAFKMQEVLRVMAFLTDVLEEFINSEQLTKQLYFFPKLALSDILLKQKGKDLCIDGQTILKYRNPLDIIGCLGKQNIFSTVPISSYNEGIVSFGLSNLGFVLLGMCLLEDCYNGCCNSSAQICKSLVEGKIEEMFEIYKDEAAQETVSQFCSFIETLIFQNGSPTKLSLSQVKLFCSQLLKQQQMMVLKNKTEAKTKNIISDVSTSLMMKKEKIEIKNQNEKNQISDQRHKITQTNTARAMKIKKSTIHKNQQRKPKDIDQLARSQSQCQTDEKKGDRLGLRSMTNILKYEQIDKKWGESEQLFKDMPQFENTPSKIFNNQTNEQLETIQISGSHRESILAFR